MSSLETEVQSLQNLDEAFRWSRRRDPKATPVETIPQDEYTHDVLFQTNHTEFVVFDAT